MVTKERILETLSAIVDPDLGKDIVTLGFIANLEVEEGSDGAHVLLERLSISNADRSARWMVLDLPLRQQHRRN